MKTSQKIQLYIGGLGFVTLGVLLHSIQNLLPEIAVKVIAACLGMLALVAARYAWKMICAMRLDYLTVQAKKSEVNLLQQDLLSQETDRQIKVAQWNLLEHIQTTRIAPNT